MTKRVTNLVAIFRGALRMIVWMGFSSPMVLSACSGGTGEELSNSNSQFARTEISLGVGSKTIQLSWEEPNFYANGEPLRESLGYKVHLSHNSQAPQSITVGHTNGLTISGLEEGQYEFWVTALTDAGLESSESPKADLFLGNP